MKKIGVVNRGFKKMNKTLAIGISSITSTLRYPDSYSYKSISSLY